MAFMRQLLNGKTNSSDCVDIWITPYCQRKRGCCIVLGWRYNSWLIRPVYDQSANFGPAKLPTFLIRRTLRTQKVKLDFLWCPKRIGSDGLRPFTVRRL